MFTTTINGNTILLQLIMNNIPLELKNLYFGIEKKY